MSYYFYNYHGTESKQMVVNLSNEYQHYLWRPFDNQWIPPEHLRPTFMIWSLAHLLNFFPNHDYSIYLVFHNHRVIHRSCVFPRYFRFPFMSEADLQIGNTWTEPSHRGKGIATFAIFNIIKSQQKPGRRFWYVVEDVNKASIRVIEKAGFMKHGCGSRRKRFGLGILGYFELETVCQFS